MKEDPTVCEYDGDPRQYACAHDEQCDDCFMVDHLKECEWCIHYDHPSRKLQVQHDTGERKYEAHVELTDERFREVAQALGEVLQEQGYRWGEPLSANQE